MSRPPANQAPPHSATPTALHESKPLSFETWAAEVQGVLTFVIEPDEWRKYYDAGLVPVDAIAQHTTDEEV